MKKPFRQRRVAELLRRELATALNEALRGEGGPLVTVTEVRPCRDLTSAEVWVSILGDTKQRLNRLNQVQADAGRYRFQIAHRVELRKVPELRFKLDETLDYAERIDSLLKASNLSELPTPVEDESEE